MSSTTASGESDVTDERWFDRVVAQAQIVEIFDGDGTHAGWRAGHPLCRGAVVYDSTPEAAFTQFRSVLEGWVEVHQKLGNKVPDIL